MKKNKINKNLKKVAGDIIDLMFNYEESIEDGLLTIRIPIKNQSSKFEEACASFSPDKNKKR